MDKDKTIDNFPTYSEPLTIEEVSLKLNVSPEMLKAYIEPVITKIKYLEGRFAAGSIE